MESEHSKTSAEIKYADIIHGSRPYSAVYPPMDRSDRAAQFAPFAALTGYEAAVEEAARLTDQQTELAEDESVRLDAALRRLAADESGSPVRITYFRSDSRKAGGAYETVTARVREIIPCMGHLVLEDRRVLLLRDIRRIEWTE